MNTSYERNGYFTEEELKDGIPPKELLGKKRVAVVECLQDIPCDACRNACKFSAVMKNDINDPPKIDLDRCNACLQCVRECPGLAVFVLAIKNGKAEITIPWEMSWIPKVGETVDVLGRNGQKVGKGVILRVIPPMKMNKTALVTFETDEDLIMKARNFRRASNA